MKPNRRLLVVAPVLLCLFCLLVSGTVYFYISNQPPSTLTSDSGYYVRWTRVYYLGGFPSTAFEIEGADVSTFEILDEAEVYALDKEHVYFHGQIIPEADPDTFELLESPYSRDKNHVYVSDAIHSNDPANFEIVHGNVMRDSQHIYWSQEIISDDPESLEILFSQDYYTYLKDSRNVFVNGSLITGADPNTFEVLMAGYGRDASQVYYFDQDLPADLSTFEILEIPYSRDAQNVFWRENSILNADPETFHVLNANFECSADAQTAFYQDRPIPNFNPNTLPTDSQVTNCDANGIYFSR